MLRLFAIALLTLFSVPGLMAQNGWRMEGGDPSRTNVSRASGPSSNPTFRVIAANVSGSLRRIADDGSLILTDGASVSSYTHEGRLRWRTGPLAGLNGAVVDVALAPSGIVYVSSVNRLLALDAQTGRSAWAQPFIANSGDDSGPLVVGLDGTIYFHTGSSATGIQEKLTAINPDGSRKWDYAGNAGRASGRPVFSNDGATGYLPQLRSSGGGSMIGLSAASGQVIYETACDVRSGVFAYSPTNLLYTGDVNHNILQFPSETRSCSVSTSGLIVTDTAAVLKSLLVVQVSVPGTGNSYAAVDTQGQIIWSRIDPLTAGFADSTGGEGSGTFFAIAPQTNELLAIRIATGEELWRQRFSSPVSGLLLGGDGNLYLVVGSDLLRADSRRPDSTTGAKPLTTVQPTSFAAKGSDGALAFAATSTVGLVAAYGLNEGAGSTTADATGNGFNGTLTNGTVWTTAGKNGNALVFDGLDDKVTLPSTLDIAALPFTVEAWINPVDFADWRAFFSKRAAWSPTQMRFDAGLAISTGAVYVTTASSTVNFVYAPPVNTWTHVAVEADSTGTRLYVNGTLRETLSAITLGTGSAAPVVIGGSADDDDHFAGSIDDLRLYSRALTQSEIQSDMNAGVGNPALKITQPSAGSSVIGSTVNVTYTSYGDLIEVNHVHFQLDSSPVVMDMTFDGVYQFTSVPVGAHVLAGWLVRADHSKILGTDDSVSFNTSVSDSIPPTVSLTNPANGATVSGAVSVSANASDNVGIAGVQFLLDGQALGAEDTTAAYAIVWNTATATNGTHTLAARARDLAGNLTTSTSISVTVSNGGSNPAVTGQWGAVTTWPLVPVHLNLLPTGKILAWDNALDHASHTNTSVVWDPVTGTFTDVSNAAVNLFCAGQTQLMDGKVLVVGGHIDNDIGTKDVSLFDPFTQTWTPKTQMSYARWYPSATTLADGRVLALVGTSTCKDCISSTPEIYNPATDSWQQLTGAASAFARYYPHAFVLPDGKVLVTGTSQVATATNFSIPTRVLDINTQSWTTVDPTTNADGFSAMFLPGKVVRVGGTWDDGSGFPLTATSVLDMTAGSPAWRTTAPMQFSRVLHNLTILPDGTVLTTGGASDAGVNPPANSIIYAAELWNPVSETWTTLSAMQTPRLYHSTTSLLPDGRVVVAGGGRAFTTDEFNAEVFSPPYLFKGPRPAITSAPGQAAYGSTIFVATPDASSIAKVSLVRLSSVTHTTNFNQRYADLTFQQVAGGLNVNVPANANLAPPGYYMLFILNGNGVPSIAPFIQLVPNVTDSVPPAAPSNLTATAAGSTQINLSWTASTDNVGVTGYRVERCLGTGCSNFSQIGTPAGTSYNDSALASGTTYRYRVRAADAAGNLSAYSNVAAATTVAADSTAPTAPGNARAFPGGTPASIAATQTYLDNTNRTTHTSAAFNSTGGDLIVVFASTRESAATMTLTDNKSNTWIAAAGPTNHSSASIDQRSRLWYAKAASVGTGHTVTLGLSTTNSAAISVLVIKGSRTASPLDITSLITNNSGSAGTSITSAAVNTTQPGDLLIDFAKSTAAATWTAGSGYKLETTASSNVLAAEDKLAGVAGSYSAAWTMTPAVNWQNVLTSVVSANVALGNTQITTAWSPATDNIGVTGYLIERCAGSACANFSQIGTTGFSTTLYTDTGLTAGASYSYRFRATDAAGNLGPYSTIVSATTSGADTTVPTAPTNLSAAASGSQINLTWTASTDNVGVTGYRLERCQGVSCSTFAQIATPAATAYSDTGLAAGTSYSYRVRATDAAGNLSSYSSVATAVTPVPDTTAPTPPSNLTATPATSNQINLAWTASTDNVGVTGYRLERCVGAGCSSFGQIAAPPGTTYSDTGLVANTSYSYRVRATDAAGNLSAYSSVRSATTPPIAVSGPVAAYSFDEGSGTTVADSSGNGNSGTISNTTWTSASKYGNALAFNGTSSRVTINDSASLHLTSGMTLEAWVYPTATPSGWVDLIYKQDDIYMLEASSTFGLGPTAGGTFGNGFQAVPGPSPIAVNAWTHVAVTFDGAVLRLWLNGLNVAAQPQTSPLNVSTLPLQIGGDSIYGQYFTGRIDEVRVYNRALTKTQLEVDMNTPVGTSGDVTAPSAPGILGAFAGGTPAAIIARQAYINSTPLVTHTSAPFDSTGGDLIVVFSSSHANVTFTPSDSKGNSWITAKGPTNHSPGVDLRSQLWYAKAVNTGTGHTVTMNLSLAQPLVISVLVIKGSDAVAPIDITSSITDDGGIATTSIASASISTSRPGDLLIDFAKSSSGVTWTAAAGYTFESTASSNYLAAEAAIAGAPGGYIANWTMTPGVSWQNVITSVVSANASASSSQITMTWSPSTDNIGVTGYLIERCAGAGCSSFVPAGSTSGFSTTTYTDTGLSSGTSYSYRIRATDAAGRLSAYSATVSVTTQ